MGLEYDRVEKTRIVSRMPLARRYLDVCVSRWDINCGKCAKCLRTALVLEILGKLDRFRRCLRPGGLPGAPGPLHRERSSWVAASIPLP